MPPTITFQTPTSSLEILIRQLTIAGWTGRNMSKVEHHIEELAELGVSRPSQTPLFYKVSPSLLGTTDRLQVLGENTSGEAEPMIVRHGGRLWLGLASDHTDRALEAHSVAHSKQVCAKPAADWLWPLEDVIDRADDLQVRSWIREGGEWALYQEGALAELRPLKELIAAAALPEDGAMLCGTFPTIGGVRPSSQFRMELFDPVLERRIGAEYRIETLDVVS